MALIMYRNKDGTLTELGGTTTIFTEHALNWLEDETYKNCYYRVIDGEKEWIKPPMIVGAEYRTIERYEGKIVYTKLIDCGNLPNTADKAIEVGVKGSNAFYLRPIIYMSGGQLSPYPYIRTTFDVLTRIYLNNVGSLVISTNYDLSAYTAKAIIKYVKE